MENRDLTVIWEQTPDTVDVVSTVTVNLRRSLYLQIYDIFFIRGLRSYRSDLWRHYPTHTGQNVHLKCVFHQGCALPLPSPAGDKVVSLVLVDCETFYWYEVETRNRVFLYHLGCITSCGRFKCHPQIDNNQLYYLKWVLLEACAGVSICTLVSDGIGGCISQG